MVVVAPARLAARIHSTSMNTAGEAAARVCSQVPSYRQNADPSLRSDVAAHCAEVFNTVARCLETESTPQRADFESTATHAMRRVTQEIPLPDFLQAFRISQLTLWESILEISNGTPEMHSAAMRSAEWVMRVIEAGSTAAAQSYLEAQQYLVADGNRITRDLVDDLLGGRLPVVEPRRAALRTAGLAPGSSIVVASAQFCSSAQDQRPLDRALAYARRHTGSRGLITIRHGELVGILPAEERSLGQELAAIRNVLDTLGREGIDLSVGMSTIHRGLAAVPRAHREATTARGTLRGKPGLRRLDALTAFDYLLARPDETAVRLITPRVRQFVEEDLAADSVYIDTLRAYVAANLNAKAAAEELFVHSNTAYYRLERIAQRTGKDIRRFDEVLDLLVAVRLLCPTAVDGMHA